MNSNKNPNQLIEFRNIYLTDKYPSARGIGYDCVDVLSDIIDRICLNNLLSHQNDHQGELQDEIDTDNIENMKSPRDQIESVMGISVDSSATNPNNNINENDGSMLPLSFSSSSYNYVVPRKPTKKKKKKRKFKHIAIPTGEAETEEFKRKYKKYICDYEAILCQQYNHRVRNYNHNLSSSNNNSSNSNHQNEEGEEIGGKYWDQRYRLLSKFDEGILLDPESWYSITPEVIANHISQRCIHSAKVSGKKLRTALDCFSGCGGNSISLLLNQKRVGDCLYNIFTNFDKNAEFTVTEKDRSNINDNLNYCDTKYSDFLGYVNGVDCIASTTDTVKMKEGFQHVIAVDIDSSKIKYIQHNVDVYNRNNIKNHNNRLDNKYNNYFYDNCISNDDYSERFVPICDDVNEIFVKLGSNTDSIENIIFNNHTPSNIINNNNSNNNSNNSNSIHDKSHYDDEDVEVDVDSNNNNDNNNNSSRSNHNHNTMDEVDINTTADVSNNGDSTKCSTANSNPNSSDTNKSDNNDEVDVSSTANSSAYIGKGHNDNHNNHINQNSNDGVDVTFLAPPWGGPNYLNTTSFDLHTMLPSGDGFSLVQAAVKVSENIVFMIPRNTSRKQLKALVRSLQTIDNPNSIITNSIGSNCNNNENIGESINVSNNSKANNIHSSNDNNDNNNIIRNIKCIVEDIYLYKKHKMTVVYLGNLFV